MKRFILLIIGLLLILLNNTRAQNHPPISPKWVFEPWVWEDENNTREAVDNLINGYRSNEIPVGAVIIDSPWEAQVDGTGDYNDTTNNGYNTFVFNEHQYYNSKGFIDSLKNVKGLHVILWITGIIDSACGLWEDAYNKHYFVNNGARTGWWKGSKRASHIDFFNDTAKTYWEEKMDTLILYNDYEIDGWKVDWSDYWLRGLSSITTAIGDTTPEAYSNAYYSEMYNYIKSKRDSGMILARPYCKQYGDKPYFFAPISVNTGGWVGDQWNNWSDTCGLQLALNNIFISADAGYATVGFDIGGYRNKKFPPDRILFLRWAQLGAMIPIMINGGDKDNCHQPWLFSPKQSTIDIYRYYAKLHHQLVPYLYSYDILAHITDTSIVRPFGERNGSSWDNSPRGDYDYSYLLGENIFISAIAEAPSSVEGDFDKIITFPRGSWINYWNDDEIYPGESTDTINYPLDKYPIFIRSGAIIPMNVDDPETGHGPGTGSNLTLLIYPDGYSTYEYHIDALNSTEITCDEHSGEGYTISFSGNFNEDTIIIRLKNNIEPENIILNNSEILDKKNSFDEFKNSSKGWFHGKMESSFNTYTWIRYTEPVNTVEVLTTSCTLNLFPDNYEVSILNEGNEYYIDRHFTLINVPDEYKDFSMIKTANSHKDTVNLDFHFNICSGSDIYIAYDHRLPIPDWMISDNYINTGDTIYVDDPWLGYFNVWKRTVQPGVVAFHDNEGDDNSAMYFVFYKTYESISVYTKVFLQGPYAGNDSMFTSLMQGGYISLSQPYIDSPWNYSGTESVLSIPNSDIVDWVLIELRSTYNGSAVARRAAFVKSSGNMVDMDGTSPVNFVGISTGDYYIIIKHRNHLAVMSANAVTLPNNSAYDFTKNSSSTYGVNPMATLGDGNYGMWAGDVNGNGTVNYAINSDRTALLNDLGNNLIATKNGYYNTDVNMNGTVNYGISSDRTMILNVLGNSLIATKSTQVP